MHKWIVHFVLDNSAEPSHNVHVAVTSFTTRNDEELAMNSAREHLSNPGIWRCHTIEYLGEEYGSHRKAGTSR